MQMMMMFALVALLIGLSKGGLGGPVPVSMTAPLLSLVMPVSKAIGIILPLLIFADMFALYFYWRKWDARYIRLMLPAAVIGVVFGTLLLAVLPNVVLRHLIGVFTLIAVLYKIFSDRLKQFEYHARGWHGTLAGWLAGFGSALANAGAPPFTAYMLLQTDFNPTMFIGTATLFFAIVNALKIPAFLASNVMDVNLLTNIVWVLPIIPFGVWLGRRLLRYVNPVAFERFMLGSLCLLSLWLIVT